MLSASGTAACIDLQLPVVEVASGGAPQGILGMSLVYLSIRIGVPINCRLSL